MPALVSRHAVRTNDLTECMTNGFEVASGLNHFPTFSLLPKADAETCPYGVHDRCSHRDAEDQSRCVVEIGISSPLAQP